MGETPHQQQREIPEGRTNDGSGKINFDLMPVRYFAKCNQYMYPLLFPSLQTALMDLADTIVGGATGPGLSGGQKRRLVVALQLLKLPSVIFLDEPTSGNKHTYIAEYLLCLGMCV